MGHKLVDLVGLRFNLLTVVEKMPSRKYGDSYKRRWKCVCDCGKETEFDTGQLTSKRTKSCGCLHKESSIENSRKTRHLIANPDASLNVIFSSYQRNAQKRNLEWLLTKEQATKLFSGDCYFCGLPPSNTYKSTYYKKLYSGIDRLNNEHGYTMENTVSCCSTCNHAKHTMTEQQFMQWIDRIFKHQFRRAMQELDK